VEARVDALRQHPARLHWIGPDHLQQQPFDAQAGVLKCLWCVAE